MTNAIGDSLEIARDLIAVRYHRADAKSLLARCDAWLANHSNFENELRDAYPANGGAMLNAQLDNLDRAKHTVYGVRVNCLDHGVTA